MLIYSESQPITVSSGDKIYLHEFLTRGDYKAIRRRLFGQAEFEDGKIKQTGEALLAMRESEDFAMLVAIKKIVGADGNEKEKNEAYIESLAMEDFELLQPKVDVLLTPKKKSPSELSAS